MINLDGCGFSDSFRQTVEKSFYVVYFILLPTYIFVGLISNLLLLYVFYKQKKSDSCYTYQLALTISKSLETLIFGTYLMALYSGAGLLNFSPKKDWFVQNYFLMFYTAKPGAPSHMVFIVNSLLLSVAMSADRLFALWKPFKHKAINHSKHQMIAIMICALLALLVCIEGYWANEIVTNGDRYEIIPNQYFINSTINHVVTFAMISVRLGGVVVLIILNIAIVLVYQRHAKKALKAVAADEQVLRAKKATQKALFRLTVCQSCLMLANQIPHSSAFLIRHQSDYLARCGLAVAPFADACVMVTDSLNFFVIIAISKRIRQLLPCVNASGVAPNPPALVDPVGSRPTDREILQAA